MLPDAYSNFADVFEKKGAETLPPRHPYDCPVDLMPRKEVPLGCTCALSFPELAALKVYIKNNLVCGGRLPSSSTAGGPAFFSVKKKDRCLQHCR